MVVTTKSTKYVKLSEMTPLPHVEITFSIATEDFLILHSNPCVLAIITLYGPMYTSFMTNRKECARHPKRR